MVLLWRSSQVPSRQGPALEIARDFAAALEAPEPDADRLRSLHDAFMAAGGALVQPEQLPESAGDPALRESFATALWMMTRLEYGTLFSDPVLDTYGSKTLPYFKVDWRGDAAALERLRGLIRGELGLGEDGLARIERQVEERLADARRKAEVVRALREEFELRDGHPDLRLNIKRLTWFLYPQCGLESDEVELIVIGTAVFLCIPFDSDELDTARFRAMGAEEQEPIRRFLRKVAQFKPQQFTNFPVFGFLDGSRLDEDWLESLSERCSLPTEALAEEIARLVAILPLGEVDKFVVHDVWGHVWQAAMLDFEHMYQELGKYADHLDWQESAPLPGGASLALKDCFSGTGDGFALDSERFEAFVAAEVTERMPVAYSAVVAEMFADVVEYKFLAQHPDKRADMPSSSVFKEWPTKLDLLVKDMPFYFRQATQVFSRSLEPGEHRRALRRQMQAAGAGERAAEAALEAMKAVWSRLEAERFSAEPRWSEAGEGALSVNLYGRLLLNFLSLHHALVTTVREIEAWDYEGAPVRAFYDLLLLSLSVFFEQDRGRNLWRLDEYMRLNLTERCQATLAALTET